MDTGGIKKILNWNIGGINNLYNLDSKSFKILGEHDIIGLTETWCKNKIVINSLNNHQIFESFADVNVSGKGRPSGGLALLINKNVIKEVELVESNKYFIAVRLVGKNNKKWIVILTYIIPLDINFENKIEEMIAVTRESVHKHIVSNIIWMGDFNARVGSSNLWVNDLWYIGNKNVWVDRCSDDKEINRNGRILIEKILEENLILLNGRSEGDIDGKATFCNFKGKSSIDLVFVNENVAELVDRFEILDWPESDHFPCSLQFSKLDHVISKEKKKIIWKNELKEEFNNVLDSELKDSSSMDYGKLAIIIRDTADKCGMSKIVYHNASTPNKPWFDKECINYKKIVNSKLKLARKSKWEEEDREAYLRARREYCNLRKSKKASYLLSMQDKFHNIRYATDFWKVVKSFKYTEFVENNIDYGKWKDFYDRTQRPGEIMEGNFLNEKQEQIESDFTLIELIQALKKLGNGKAAGPDLIPNEILKNSSPTFKITLLQMFNKIWETEITPLEWSGSETVMLFKKGDKSDPANYRPISLLNTSLKLFTTLIQNRLLKWADENDIIPDCQMGFRKGRGCMDHIFNLQALLQIGTRRNKVYAAFIDFSRCFNSIIHKRLWEKLYQLKVSGKVIRTLKSIYDRAFTKIRLKGGLSDDINITEGVLQGESISPLLFNLYLSEIEKKLIEWDVPGVKVQNEEIHSLLFADDAVILAPGAGPLQRKLNHLADYFDELGLMVNISKTKIVRFRRRQRSKNETFYFKNEKLEIVQEYIYLGVKFRENVLTNETAKYFKMKGKSAVSKASNLVFKGRAEAIDPKLKLFDSIVVPTCLYGAHIWGLSDFDEIEKVQTFFLKKSLGLKTCVSNAAVRLECSRVKLSYKIVSMLLSFISKIWGSSEKDYIKKCYNQLLRNSNIAGEEFKYNWCLKVKEIFEKTGFINIWNSQDPQLLLAGKEAILKKWHAYLIEDDIIMVNKSKTYKAYGMIFKAELSRDNFYLNSRIGTHIARCLTQSRMGDGNFWFRGYNVKLNINDLCTLCGKDNENMIHILFYCKMHEASRKKYIKEYMVRGDSDDENYCNILANLNDTKLRNVFLFMQNVVIYRDQFRIYDNM